MKPHYQYLKYVIRHKWFVFVAGRKVHAPLWRLIIHDWSKFMPSEWFPYVKKFYKGGKNKEEFMAAFLHHLHHNPHHWQHWILPSYDTEKKSQVFEMPEKFVHEMIADWMGAGRAITGKWEVDEWWEKHKSTIRLHPNTRVLVEDLLEVA